MTLTLIPLVTMTQRERYDAIMALRASGRSYSQIGSQLGLTTGAVAGIIRRGVPNETKAMRTIVNGQVVFMTAQQIADRDDAIVSLREAGKSNVDISATLGIGQGALTKILKRLLATGRVSPKPRFDIRIAARVINEQRAAERMRKKAAEAMLAKTIARNGNEPWSDERRSLARKLFHKDRWGLGPIAEHLTRIDPSRPAVTAPEVRDLIYGQARF